MQSGIHRKREKRISDVQKSEQQKVPLHIVSHNVLQFVTCSANCSA